jgi:hypothetical protein
MCFLQQVELKLVPTKGVPALAVLSYEASPNRLGVVAFLGSWAQGKLGHEDDSLAAAFEGAPSPHPMARLSSLEPQRSILCVRWASTFYR